MCDLRDITDGIGDFVRDVVGFVEDVVDVFVDVIEEVIGWIVPNQKFQISVTKM